MYIKLNIISNEMPVAHELLNLLKKKNKFDNEQMAFVDWLYENKDISPVLFDCWRLFFLIKRDEDIASEENIKEQVQMILQDCIDSYGKEIVSEISNQELMSILNKSIDGGEIKLIKENAISTQLSYYINQGKTQIAGKRIEVQADESQFNEQLKEPGSGK